jgi:1,4-dihydroxy-2-naphthoate octaprenyltransferase
LPFILSRKKKKGTRMINRFLDYVELKTKITSIFVFLMSIGYLLYSKESINWKLTIIFFIAMFTFDLTTTAINNYIDTKDNHQTLQFPRKIALTIIYVLFSISAGLGLYLAYSTDLVVLLIGGLCFICGICYTYGPLPISRMPLGECISGFFYGFMIPFIIFYINMPSGSIISYNVNFSTISVDLNLIPIFTLILFSIIPFSVTANIMLANNICDLEKDILVKRHTLPYYIGKHSLTLFAVLYYITYAVTIIMVALKIFHPISLLSILTIFIVRKNISAFNKQQEKSITFILAIKNYIIIMGANTILIFISLFL